MQYYPEEHDKKQKEEPVKTEANTPEIKEEAQEIQKQLNAELESLKKEIDVFEINSLDTAEKQAASKIIQEHIAHIHVALSIDELSVAHLQEQIEKLREYENRFTALV